MTGYGGFPTPEHSVQIGVQNKGLPIYAGWNRRTRASTGRPLPTRLSRLSPSSCRGGTGRPFPADLTHCFDLHRNLIEHGAILPGLTLNQFSAATPDESSEAVRRRGGASS